jgi:hypothetical protein
MDCQEFEQIIFELARDMPGDITMRKSASEHASACERCAARLADQRVLSAGLRVFAQATQNELAPSHLKKELMAAFAARHTFAGSTARSAPMLKIPFFGNEGRNGSLRSGRGWPQWALAAAAAILVFFIASVVVWRREAPSDSNKLANTTTPTPALTPAPPAPTLEPTAPESPESMNDRSIARPRAVSNSARRATERRAALESLAEESEIASEFVPITYASDARVLQNGFVVRVEVPRETLISMGLPLNVERGKESVKADVMMGDNGVAYAIRVVH